MPQTSRLPLPPDAPFQQVNRTGIVQRGRKFIYFGGCDYFRLASHPAMLRAVEEGLRRYGLNVAASRITTGEHALYPQLEERAARFFGAEAAVVTSTGYASNLIAAQALAGEVSAVFIDERSHSSLHDAMIFMPCPVVRFRHRDPEDLRKKFARKRARGIVLLATDGMFSHDGSVAPLRAYRECLPDSALFLVDDAHGGGVVGKHGRGSLEWNGLGRAGVIQTVTFSKAFGAYGGAVLCSGNFRRQIWAKSRLAIGNTPLPLPLAHGAIKGIELVASDRSLRERLERNQAWTKEQLARAGWQTERTPGPIIGWSSDDLRRVEHLKRELRKRDIFPPFVRYPGAGLKGGFRFVLSSEHTREQLEKVVEALSGIGA